MREVDDGHLTNYQIALKFEDHERRLKDMEKITSKLHLDVLMKRLDDVEEDMHDMKPLVYDTVRHVVTIESEVSKISGIFSHMQKAILTGVISGIIGLITFFVTSYFNS